MPAYYHCWPAHCWAGARPPPSLAWCGHRIHPVATVRGVTGLHDGAITPRPDGSRHAIPRSARVPRDRPPRPERSAFQSAHSRRGRGADRSCPPPASPASPAPRRLAPARLPLQTVPVPIVRRHSAMPHPGRHRFRDCPAAAPVHGVYARSALDYSSYH